MLSKIQAKYWAALALIIWGGLILYFNVVSFEAYGLDEGAAMALLINWAVADNIVNPIVAFGMPDFRALLFVPLGTYWPGSIFAAKVFTIIIAFLAAMLLYHWSRNNHDDEVALIATGLFLISPLVILQIDQIAVGIYLLFMIALACKVEAKQRAAERSIGNWYFIQMLLIAVVVSLHPIGLAYPAALALRWKLDPIDKKRQTHNFIGIGITVFIILVMQAGWISLEWFSNPLTSLALAVSGMDITGIRQPSMLIGLVPMILLVLLLFKDWKELVKDTTGLTLLFAMVSGLFIADAAWAILAVALLLYRGIPLLIAINKAIKAQNFMGQRGLVMVMIVIVATISMNVGISHALQVRSNLKSAHDSLIETLALETENAGKEIRIASQWPARTMIAVRHAVLPLPPAAENGEQLLKMIKGITHIAFAHNEPSNATLTRTIAEVTHKTKTLAIQEGGVIVLIKNDKQAAQGDMSSEQASESQAPKNQAPANQVNRQ